LGIQLPKRRLKTSSYRENITGGFGNFRGLVWVVKERKTKETGY